MCIISDLDRPYCFSRRDTSPKPAIAKLRSIAVVPPSGTVDVPGPVAPIYPVLLCPITSAAKYAAVPPVDVNAKFEALKAPAPFVITNVMLLGFEVWPVAQTEVGQDTP